MASTSALSDMSSDLSNDLVSVERSLSNMATANAQGYGIYRYDARAQAAWQMVRVLACEMIDGQQKLKTNELRVLSPMLLTALDVLRARACGCIAAIRDVVENNSEAKHSPEEREDAWINEGAWATDLYEKVTGLALVRNYVARLTSPGPPSFFQGAANYAEMLQSRHMWCYLGQAPMDQDLRTRIRYAKDVWTIIKYWADSHDRLLSETERTAEDGPNFADRELKKLDSLTDELNRSFEEWKRSLSEKRKSYRKTRACDDVR